MLDEMNKEIVRNLYNEVINKRPNEFSSKTSNNGFTQYTTTARPASLKTFNQFFYAVSNAFPDFSLTIENMIVKGDRVMARYIIEGTHKENFMGIAPTGEKMAITCIDVFRISNGKVVEHWDAAHQVCASPRLGKPDNQSVDGGGRKRTLKSTPREQKQFSLRT